MSTRAPSVHSLTSPYWCPPGTRKQTMIETILATDNGMHAAYLARLVKSIDLDGCDAEQPDNLLLLMCNMVHAVDVSNVRQRMCSLLLAVVSTDVNTSH